MSLLNADALATHAAESKVPEVAAVILSDGWAALGTSAKFDFVLSNLPVHSGRVQCFSLLELLLQGAPQRLRKGGQGF